MLKKWTMAALALLLALTMVLSAACTTKENEPQTPAAGGVVETPADAPADDAVENVYETYLDDIPASWSPHTWYSAIDMVMLEFVVTPLVLTYKDADGNSVLNFEAATAVTDITADFEDKEQWGIGEDEEEGFVFQIDLNELLTWEDGTPINADTYIYSMQAQLDPAMSNNRAGRYTVGGDAIRGAFDFLNRDKAGQDYYADAVTVEIDEETILLFNPYQPSIFFGGPMADYYDSGWGPLFLDDDGENPFLAYEDEYIEVTDDIAGELMVLCENFGEGEDPEAWLQFCVVLAGEYKDADWEDVGLLKTGEYQLTYITANPISYTKFIDLMKRSWLVREEVYEGGKVTEDGVVSNDYNMTAETTCSFGPYKLVSIEEGLFTLEKNENWFGWDGEDRFYQYTYEDFGEFDVITIEVPIYIEDEVVPSGPVDLGEAGEVHPFPFAFETENLYGETITQEDIGEKEIFFCHLWATWCGPCVEEMGEMAKIAEEYGDVVGFIALLTDFDTNAKGAVKLTEYNNIPFNNVFSGAEDLAELNQMLRSGYVPTTILIDGDGNMIGEQIIGSYGTGYADFIEAALAEVRSR